MQRQSIFFNKDARAWDSGELVNLLTIVVSCGRGVGKGEFGGGMLKRRTWDVFWQKRFAWGSGPDGRVVNWYAEL